MYVLINQNMKSINTIQCPYYVWILRKSAEISDIFLPSEIVRHILLILKVKPKIMCGYGSIMILNDNGINFINSNWIQEFKIPIHDMAFVSYEREYPTIVTKDGKILFCKKYFKCDTYLKRYMEQNNISGIKKVAEGKKIIIVLTKCQKIISYHYDNFDQIKILNDTKIFKKIYVQNDHDILLLDIYGNVYKLIMKGPNCSNLLKKINILNVRKIKISTLTYFHMKNGKIHIWDGDVNIKNHKKKDYKCHMPPPNIVNFWLCNQYIMYITSNNELYYDSKRVTIPPGNVVAVCLKPTYYVILQSNFNVLIHKEWYDYQNDFRTDTNIKIDNTSRVEPHLFCTI